MSSDPPGRQELDQRPKPWLIRFPRANAVAIDGSADLLAARCSNGVGDQMEVEALTFKLQAEKAKDASQLLLWIADDIFELNSQNCIRRDVG